MRFLKNEFIWIALILIGLFFIKCDALLGPVYRFATRAIQLELDRTDARERTVRLRRKGNLT